MGFKDYTASNTTPKAYTELKAQGFEVEQKNGKYFVKIDGVSVQVHEYDTIWTVQARRNNIVDRQKKDSVDNQGKEIVLKEELNKLKEKFQVCLDVFDESLKNMKLARVNFRQYLSANNAHTLSDLKGTSAYKQGAVLQDAKFSTSSDEIAALSDVLQTNNQIQSVCSEMMYLA